MRILLILTPLVTEVFVLILVEKKEDKKKDLSEKPLKDPCASDLIIKT